ncbi:serine/threonine protein kinase [Acidobacteria bacterium AH-259-D05]|nr:serine/threonine protein kinase [Acidobacteria bacterium AH-259-D05]
MIGTTISRYKVLEKIGQGGMGEVFLAQDTTLDRKVALKFLPDELAQDPAAQRRFLREAKSAAALDHPFICHIHEVGEAEGKFFIAMEYVQGMTLQEKLAAGPLPVREAVETAIEIAEALEAAHEQSIVPLLGPSTDGTIKSGTPGAVLATPFCTFSLRLIYDCGVFMALS